MKTLFYNLKPVIIDKGDYYDAFLAEDGIIKERGNYQDLVDKTATTDSRVDLEGRPVIPGLTDCHIHLLAYAVSKEKTVNLKGVNSLQELQNITGKFIREKKIQPGEWVSGWGWNHDLFPDRKLPERLDLDLISSDCPIRLTRMCYHISVVNSRALELAGITANTADPEGGQIDRDANGQPTGILRETAMELVDRVIPPLDDKEEMKNLIRSACSDLTSYGYTTIHTDDFGHVQDRNKLLDAYLELDQAEELPLDIVLQMIINKPEDLDLYIERNMQGGRRFKRVIAGPIKILGDGSLGSRTAALKEPYSDAPQTSGILLFTVQKLDQMIKNCFESGFDTAIHAIGDLTQETVLSIYGKYKDLIFRHNLNPSIIHCQIASPEALKMYRDLDIIANFQPVFLFSDWNIASERVGLNRVKTSYCWKTFINSGIYTVGSSDAPVESFNPYWNIYAAVARKDLNGQPAKGWMPQEALNREEALALFTTHPPRLTKEQGHKGRLEAGYKADFVVLSDHPYMISEDKLKDLKALATYKDGILVHRS